MNRMPPHGQDPRRKVVMSAYACGPGPAFGSEPGAGWAFAEAAAQHNEVWVFTRERFQTAIAERLAADPELALNLHPIYVRLSETSERRKRRPRDVYWYYALWQREVAKRAAALHADLGMDVGHHVTFASDWLPAGLLTLDLPLVWGPVGGATRIPRPMLRWVGRRGLVSEVGRTTLTGAARAVWGDRAARRADVVVGLNRDVERRFARIAPVIVEPNSAITVPAGDPLPRQDGVRHAVFVGRLLGWKGARLAVAALGHPSCSDWTLDIYGEGPDELELRRTVERLRLEKRVRFLGQRPREEILDAFRSADAMLFPSMHDSAPWAVAEAVSLGCPVVCLDVGGPPLLMAGHGTAVPPDGDVVEGLARALVSVPDRFPPSPRWGPARLPALVDSWYGLAQERYSLSRR